MLWEFIKHKLAKLGCFVFIAIIAIFVGLLTTWALSWLGDPAAETKGQQVTEYAGKVLLVVTIVVGLCALAHEQWTKWRQRQPPPLPKPSHLPLRVTGGSKPPPLTAMTPSKPAAPQARSESRPYESNYDKDSRYQR